MLAILLGGCSSVPGAVAESISMAYNRAGYAKCDLSPALRDGTHIVEELRTLPTAQNLSPPHVLVGHSLGGVYMHN